MVSFVFELTTCKWRVILQWMEWLISAARKIPKRVGQWHLKLSHGDTNTRTETPESSPATPELRLGWLTNFPQGMLRSEVLFCYNFKQHWSVILHPWLLTTRRYQLQSLLMRSKATHRDGWYFTSCYSSTDRAFAVYTIGTDTGNRTNIRLTLVSHSLMTL